MILLPSYTVLHDSKFTYIIKGISPLDELTLADSLENPQVVIVVVLFTVLFSLLAYFMVIKFAGRMANHQFAPSTQVIDNYAAMHSIMIRGVNKNLGVDVANANIKKVFEERFGPGKVI